jgi:hypothetical protein
METACLASRLIISTFPSRSFPSNITFLLSVGFEVSHVHWRQSLIAPALEDSLHTVNELFSKTSLLVGRFLLLLLRGVYLSV